MGTGVFDSFTDLAHHSGVTTLAYLSGVNSLLDSCLSPMYIKKQGKLSEAKKVLKGAARRNGVELSEHLLNTDSEREGMNEATEK